MKGRWKRKKRKKLGIAQPTRGWVGRGEARRVGRDGERRQERERRNKPGSRKSQQTCCSRFLFIAVRNLFKYFSSWILGNYGLVFFFFSFFFVLSFKNKTKKMPFFNIPLLLLLLQWNERARSCVVSNCNLNASYSRHHIQSKLWVCVCTIIEEGTNKTKMKVSCD